MSLINAEGLDAYYEGFPDVTYSYEESEDGVIGYWSHDGEVPSVFSRPGDAIEGSMQIEIDEDGTMSSEVPENAIVTHDEDGTISISIEGTTEEGSNIIY